MFIQKINQIQDHFSTLNQNWLFGAGISYESKIPLMIPLTNKIESEIASENDELSKIFEAIKKTLPVNSHIEHILSHLGDLMAILSRANKEVIKIDDFVYKLEDINDLYKKIISNISDIVRYGYDVETDKKGSISTPIIKIDFHDKFVKALFKRHSDLHNRKTINFFTTNYDTLLEDALALNKQVVIDGFSGSSIGFWNPTVYSENRKINEYHLYKLHGSIDWYRDDLYSLVRVRYGTSYLSKTSNVLIYPQATKYIETQKDPFAALFKSFRNKISQGENILSVCGYSFGDNHINNEIESALYLPTNNTTLIIFIKEYMVDGELCISPILGKWHNDSKINDRIFILTDRGIYNCGMFYQGPMKSYNWWSFTGMTEFLNDEVSDYDV